MAEGEELSLALTKSEIECCNFAAFQVPGYMQILVDGEGNTYTMASERASKRSVAREDRALDQEMFSPELRLSTQTDLTEQYFAEGARAVAAADLIEDIKSGSLTQHELELAGVAAKSAR